MVIVRLILWGVCMFILTNRELDKIPTRDLTKVSYFLSFHKLIKGKTLTS